MTPLTLLGRSAEAFGPAVLEKKPLNAGVCLHGAPFLISFFSPNMHRALKNARCLAIRIASL